MSVVPSHDLELIEHLDFEHTPQCEHSGHGRFATHDDGPAYVFVRSSCMECGHTKDLYICKRKWDAIIAGHHTSCNDCGKINHSHRTYTALGWVE